MPRQEGRTIDDRARRLIRKMVLPVALIIAALLVMPRAFEWGSDFLALRDVTEFIGSRSFTSESDKIDYVRNWVNENSIHKIDEEHRSYAWDTPAVVSMLWDTHLTKSGHPHLSCGPRANAMKSILEGLGVEARIVSTFTDDYSNVRSHTFLDVLNSETGVWELHDPDFNFCVVDMNTNERLPTFRLVAEDLGPVLPISATRSGWREHRIEHLKKSYFDAVMYHDGSVIFVNPDRFDMRKRFEGNDGMTFGEFTSSTYGGPGISLTHEP